MKATPTERGFGALGGYTVVATDGTAGQIEKLDAQSGQLIISVDPLVAGRHHPCPADRDRRGGSESRTRVDRSV